MAKVAGCGPGRLRPVSTGLPFRPARRLLPIGVKGQPGEETCSGCGLPYAHAPERPQPSLRPVGGPLDGVRWDGQHWTNPLRIGCPAGIRNKWSFGRRALGWAALDQLLRIRCSASARNRPEASRLGPGRCRTCSQHPGPDRRGDRSRDDHVRRFNQMTQQLGG
jgi:hypothetical protein